MSCSFPAWSGSYPRPQTRIPASHTWFMSYRWWFAGRYDDWKSVQQSPDQHAQCMCSPVSAATHWWQDTTWGWGWGWCTSYRYADLMQQLFLTIFLSHEHDFFSHTNLMSLCKTYANTIKNLMFPQIWSCQINSLWQLSPYVRRLHSHATGFSYYLFLVSGVLIKYF